jgi:hypothetical protein
MSDAELKGELAHADLIRDLAQAQEERRKQFASIVRNVQHREAAGPANEMMDQIRRDEKFVKLLVSYEAKSEIIGMLEFVIDLKNKPVHRGRSPKMRR